MSVDQECTILMVGGSKGHIRIINLHALLTDQDAPISVINTWRAHMMSISSVCNVKVKNVILTASKDMSVRLWTSDGMLLFGEATPHYIDQFGLMDYLTIVSI